MKIAIITSLYKSDGKTSVSSNLAIIFAELELDVVLIDCDLRLPRLHRIFALDNYVGVSTLKYEQNFDALLKPFASLPNLKVVTSGPIPPNPADILFSCNIVDFLSVLKSNFDVIIIDSPPVFYSEVEYLSMLVDGVVIVVKQNTSAKYLKRVKESL